MKRYLIILLIIVTALYARTQDVNAGPDSTICIGTTIQLQGSGPSEYEYTWKSSPLDNTMSDPNSLTPTVTPNKTTIYTLEGIIMDQTNLVDNPGFEDGYTDFNSSYDYCDQANCLNSSPPIGEFAIGDNPNHFNNQFPTCGDHTYGSGDMMICNGDEYLNNTLYETTVTNINTYTDYELSAWITSLVWSLPQYGADFTFEINNEPVGQYLATSSICTWGKSNFIWNSGSSSSATIRIVNTRPIQSGLGNYFALDDIALREVHSYKDYCVVTVLNIPAPDFDIPPTSCFGDTVLITYTGNSNNDTTYHWNFGADAIIISGTGEGPYEVIWSSTGTKTTNLWIDNGCPSDTIYKDITITESPEIDITADQTSIIIGASTTLHGIILSSNNPQFTWIPDFMLTNPTNQEPQTVPLNQTTTYYFIVTDGVSMCRSIDSIEIQVTGGALTLLSLIASPDTVCKNVNSQISLSVSGGSGAYTAEWTSDPPGFSHTGPEMIVDVSPDIPTTYYVSVNDGYDTISTSIVIETYPSTEITSQPQSLTQAAGTTATFTTIAANATSYQWQISIDNGTTWINLNNGNEYSGVITSDLVINPINNSMNGNVFRCLTTGLCNDQTSNSATLTIGDSPNFISTLGKTEACDGDLITIECTVQNFIDITEFELVIDWDNSILNFSSLTEVASEINNNIVVQNSGNILTVSWTSTQGETVLNGRIFNIVFSAISDGYSTINWDDQLCTITNLAGIQPNMILSSGEATINPLPEKVNYIIADHDTINITDEIPVVMNADGGSGDELIWSLSCDGDTIGKGNPLQIMRPNITSSYYAYWINQCGKSECIEKEIIITYDFNVGYPNAFTPNGDGKNDDFKIVCIAPLSEFKMLIFSRNGTIVFESDDQNIGWDGKYNDSQLSVGAYIWKISYKIPGAGTGFEVITKTGTVTLIR